MKCTESPENKSGIMYGPIFCRQRLLSMYYYKGEKLFRYFKSHCQNRSRKAELMAESFLWEAFFFFFFANWKLTAGCQIVLRRGNTGTVILWLNDNEVSCWKRQKNVCLTPRSSATEVLQHGLLSQLESAHFRPDNATRNRLTSPCLIC